MVVLDAGAMVVALLDEGASHDRVHGLLRAGCHAPDVLRLEVQSVLRRLERAGLVPREMVESAHKLFTRFPIDYVTHAGLAVRCWELRHTVTPFDAAYVAIAEGLDVPLVTTDARLSRAPGMRCTIEVLT